MAGTFMNAGAPQYTQDSLPDLPTHLQSEAQLAAHLASRYHVSLPTARLSSHALIALNTFTSSTLGPNGGKEGSAMGACEELASRVWCRLGARAEDQAIVFLGESGSGKTTLRSHFISSILAYSSTPLATKLSYAAFVFDTLTTTKSLTTPTASKAGLFYELQYDTGSASRPTLIGGKLLDHRLERSRIASVPTGERSFHALYYLLAGTSSAEKNHLGLETTAHHAADIRVLGSTQKRWRYLGHPTQLKVGIDDANGFQQFKTALRKLEFPRSNIAEVCQVLATILHIGQLEFCTAQATTPSADDSGGYSHEGGEMVTAVKNREVLAIVAAFLGVNIQDLETCLGYKTKNLYNERVTVMLDPHGARKNADELARTLYSLLVAYVIENINQKTCAMDESVANTISVVDFPGFSPVSATGSALDQLLNNSATEALYNFSMQSFFEQQSQFLESEDIHLPATSYFDNTDALRGLLKPGNGLLSILDDQMKRGKTDIQFLDAIRKRFDNKNTAIEVGAATSILPGSNFPTHNAHASFTVRHYAGEVEYPVDGLIENDSDVVSGDVMNLIKSTKSGFVRSLFGQEALRTTLHPQEQNTIVQATLSSKPLRQPSVARRKMGRPARPSIRKFDTTVEVGNEGAGTRPLVRGSRPERASDAPTQGAAGEFLSSLQTITKSLSTATTNPYFVFCLKPNDRRIARQFDSKCVRSQIQTLGITEMSQRLKNVDYSVFLPFGEFLGLVDSEQMIIGSERDKAEAIISDKEWPRNEARVGSTGILLSERLWALTAKVNLSHGPSSHQRATSPYFDNSDDTFRTANNYGLSESKVALLESTSPAYLDENQGPYFRGRDVDMKSDAGASALQGGDLFRNLETREEMAEKGNEKKLEEVDYMTQSGSRKRWLFLVWMLTFFIPDFLIMKVGRIPRRDIRIAWREKLAINLLIWLGCGFAIFFIVLFPGLVCPKQHVFSNAELSSYNGKGGNAAYIAVRGVVFDLSNFLQAHYPSIISDYTLERFAGTDATALFPVQVSAMCQGADGSIDPAVQLTYQTTHYSGQTTVSSAASVYAQYHDFRWATVDYRPTWFTEQMLYMEKNYYKGNVGYPPSYVKQLAEDSTYIAYMNKRVYDLTPYVAGGAAPQYPPDYNKTGALPNSKYMDASVVSLFTQHAGADITSDWNNLDLDPEMKSRMKLCLDNLFYVGNLDTRSSTRCQFSRYLLLAVSIVLVSVIGVKFLAALQFNRDTIPEHVDKFIICTVPAYTEDEESLRRAIDSAARMKYDDKRKLLVIICDGMIIGRGNDKPTPRIVLDILGVPETLDPEPLSFESLGEGMRQHNMGKVYSGLYEVQGHIVPFLVIVKIGKPSEVSRPGNRGKRDSQMILMRFLNRVHYNLALSPLELELHHQIRNIIGVNPTLYDFLLQIDADTDVAPDSATRFVAAFLHDTRLIGVCGETELANPKASMVTMMQVYEYYISHNLTKAFESLFGSVTCLPGCFSMYRIRDANSGKPLFVSRDVVEAYSEIRVDTLHTKNLLHLGEDRFLTTLLLKFHGRYKTKYISRAHAQTIAPDTWTVFLSQRRRWINSTVHNLVELIPLQQLCGCFCFSMRFVVFLDLMSTLVQPVIVGYIAYLIVTVIREPDMVPVTAFILLGAIYGLQAIIFLAHGKFEMIMWMFIYMLATPVFALGLPLYAFWHMDDFSWGSTRVITGEKGQQVVVSDEGKFDPRSIPRKRWEEWQQELWDSQTQHEDGTVVSVDEDVRSQVSGFTYATKANAWVSQTALNPLPPSEYGAGNRPPSRLYLHAPPPRQDSRMSVYQPTTSALGYEMSEFGALQTLPSEDVILAEIRDFLHGANLMQVTKKSVKIEMERRFGVNLDAKRAYIGSATESVLAGAL